MTWRIVSPSNQILFEKRDHQIYCYDQVTETALHINGIVISASKRKEFEGKASIFPDDPLYERALRECYFPECLKESGYILK